MKLFKIMMALMLVFALVVPAALAEDEADVCEPCTTKCSPTDIGCPGTNQGETAGSVIYSCVYGNLYEIPGLNADGTLDLVTDITDGYSDCPVIIDLCECDVIESGSMILTAGTDVTLKLSILVNGQAGVPGAYFNDSFSGRVLMSNSRAFLCDPVMCATPIVLTTASVVPGDTTIAYWCDRDGDGQFDLLNEVNDTGDVVWREDAFQSWTMTGTCDTTATTNTSAFLTQNSLKVENVDDNLRMTHMAVDIPEVIVLPTISECSTISIRVDVFFGGTSICPTDDSQCSCVFDLYTVCCAASSNTLIYPYFTSLTADDFWNGIVITNLSSKTGSVTLTAYEKNGNQVTFTTPEIGAYSQYVNTLENIDWGDNYGGVSCWIKAVAPFNIDGFAFMANDVHDSMGYLPRQLSGM